MSSEMEPPADISWLKMEPIGGLRGRWRTQRIATVGNEPIHLSGHWTRKGAERYAQRHACEHYRYEIHQIPRCGHDR